jgi:FKBP-type peptidyl-prolyl cis-trans isomerase FkpA
VRPYLLLFPVVLTCCSTPKPAAVPDAAANKAYIDLAITQPGAVRTPSGLIYRELRAGTGTSPLPNDTVNVSYHGTLANGKEFDASNGIKFPLNRVIPCWTEGVQKMKVGGKAELVCPASIGYGEAGSPPEIPGGATLIFEIELLGIG